MDKINDIAGAGKIVEVIADLTKRGIGTLYTDWAQPHAEVRKMKMLNAAQIETEHAVAIAQATGMIESDQLAIRAGKRLQIQEIRRQNNIERTLSLVSEHVSSEIPSERVDTDWAVRFFDIIQDVSNDQAQELWAKILAGEIKQPGTFSLRTLEVLRNISTQEALIFSEKVCPLVVESNFIMKIDNRSDLDKYGLSFTDVLLMRDVGLIHDGDMTSKMLREMKDKTLVLRGKDKTMLFKANVDSFDVPALVLTPAGQELYSLNDNALNDFYCADAEQYFERNGFIDLTKNTSESQAVIE